MYIFKNKRLGPHFLVRMRIAVCAVTLLLVAGSRAQTDVASKPLYRDPVYDGAADPSVVWNPHIQRWWMFYTNRRANAPGLSGVTWVHGTRIGIAESADAGRTWQYVGTAEIDLPPETGGAEPTHWAPEVLTAPDGLHHMFLTVVPGIFENWNHPRAIVHLTSRDLRQWSNASPLQLASDRVIDACVLRLPDGSWRLWYNNERDRKSIYFADSADLNHWQDRGKAVGDQAGEGPKVFRWQNSWWMVTDVWDGLAVYRSEDTLVWNRQTGNLLQQPGQGADDQVKGGHPDVVVSGDRAYIFYFTHPGRRGPDSARDANEQRRSSIQAAELVLIDGRLTCDRDAPLRIHLAPDATTSAGIDVLPVSIRVDASRPLGRLKPIWRFFGADEPNYAYMKDGKKLLGELGELRPGEVFFRTHNLLNTGDGTPALKWGSTNVYSEDERGRPIYDWRIVDLIFDTYLQRGIRPYVELGFMPKALSTRPEPYKHEWRPGFPYEEVYTGWAYPPKDYSRWGELVHQWVRHCVEKYGRAEVERWYWETWNEANIPYWQGTAAEFYRLHDYAIAAVRQALPSARVGGPDMAGSDPIFLKDFLEHCLRGANYATGGKGTPIDFVSFHAKGAPRFVDDHVQMGIAAQLRTIDSGFATIASFPELKNVPIVIGESDPEGCAACQGAQLSYRNGTMYSSYTAASFAREHDLADRHGVNLVGALSWAFTFEDQAYFAGFRQLASNGLDLPVLNVFRMFARMDGERVAAASTGAVPLDSILAEGVRGAPDVGVLASQAAGKVFVMVWHYHDDDLPGVDASVELEVSGLDDETDSVRVTHYRVDADHSNAYTAWKRMGSPVAPNRKQYAQLEAEGQLTTIGLPTTTDLRSGRTTFSFSLPRQAVSLLVFEARGRP